MESLKTKITRASNYTKSDDWTLPPKKTKDCGWTSSLRSYFVRGTYWSYRFNAVFGLFLLRIQSSYFVSYHQLLVNLASRLSKIYNSHYNLLYEILRWTLSICFTFYYKPARILCASCAAWSAGCAGAVHLYCGYFSDSGLGHWSFYSTGPFDCTFCSAF